MLQFSGYFKESVPESNAENYRVRRVTLLLYLADGSLQVSEPKQDNSGIPQGVFVRRHRVPRDGGGGVGGGSGGDGGDAVGPCDLAVGGTVTVYGRTFFLVCFLYECARVVRAKERMLLLQLDASNHHHVYTFTPSFTIANRPTATRSRASGTPAASASSRARRSRCHRTPRRRARRRRPKVRV